MKLQKLLFCFGLLLTFGLKTWADTEPANDVYTGADPMAENGTVLGSIGTPATDQDDWYVISTTNDGNITLSYSDDTPGLYSTLYLYDADGTTQLGWSYVSGSGSITVNGLAAGTYYARVYFYSPGNYGAYQLDNSVAANPIAVDNEPNDSPLQALPMSENTSATGHIGYYKNGGYDYDDYYALTTTDDGNITIALSTTESTHYNTIYLYDADGTTQLGFTYVYGSSSITVNGLAAGTYYVRVNYYSGGNYSGYTLTNTLTTSGIVNDNEPNGSVLQALPMSQNTSATGHIGYYKNGGYDYDDYYALTTTDDGNITIALSTTEPTHYNSIYLYDADGTTQLGFTYVYGSSSITVNGLAAGTYYIRVNYYSPGSYSGYTLTNTFTTDGVVNDSEPNGTPADAITMSENSSATGHIGYRVNGGGYDEDDWYVFTTTNDGNITLSYSDNTPGLYSVLYLYDADGTTQLSWTYVTGSGSITVNGLAAGTYYARVNFYYSGNYGGYTLTNSLAEPTYANDAEPNNDFASAVSMQTNSTTEGHIDYRLNGGTYDSEDNYVVVLNSSGDLTVSINTENAGSYTQMYLYNSSEVQINSIGTYTGASFTNTGLAAGTYYVRIFYYSSGNYDSYSLTNNFCPDAITIEAAGETVFCEGESVTLSTPDHHLNYAWSDGSTSETNTVTLSGENYLTIDNGGGCVRTSNTITTESKPLPVAVISADGPTTFCEGGNVTLSVPAGPDAYLWSTGETTPTITVSTTGNYSVQLFKNDCTAVSDPITVTVNPNPAPVITPDGPTTFCEGGSVNLTSSVASSYLWSTGAETPSIMADATGDFSVKVTDANGCSGTSATTSVTENPNPVSGIVADGPTEFCSGGSVNLTASGGTSYLWSTGETTSSINVTSTGDYSVTAYTAAGCSDISSTISVTVTACGSVTIVADGPTEFCEGGSVTLTSSEAEGNVWNTGATTQSIVVTTSGNYYTVNGPNTSNTISVTVNPNPSITIAASGSTIICYGGSVELVATSSSSNLQWRLNGNDIPGANSDTYMATTFGSYTCVATEGECITESNSIPIRHEKSIPVSPAGSVSICPSSTVTLSVANPTGATFQWYRNGVAITGATNNTYDAGSPGTYYAIVTKGSCMHKSKKVQVTISCRESVDAIPMIVNPNPAQDEFNVSYSVESAGKIQLVITDIAGRIVNMQNLYREPGIYSERFSAVNLPSGLYLITMQEESGKIYQEKLVIEK